MSLISDLNNINFDDENIAKKIIRNKKLLADLLECTSSEKASVKYRSFKVLTLLSKKKSEMLYKEWDFFVKLLYNDNTFLRAIGVRIIANLTRVDTENKFEIILDKYFNLLNDKSMINAANVAEYFGIIAKEKPHLQSKIINKIFDIDKTNHSSECKNIIKGKAILTFYEHFNDFKDKEKIIKFVKNELNNSRQPTRKKAEKFIKKYL
jgi:hypothetical protein